MSNDNLLNLTNYVNKKVFLPCPFCGGGAVSINYKEVMGHDVEKPYFITCQECEAGTGYYSTLSEAREAWNMRWSL